jgi:hypothetical protein
VAEWHLLQEAVSSVGHKSKSPAHQDDILAGDLLFLQPQETLGVPFALQVFRHDTKGSSEESRELVQDMLCFDVKLTNKLSGTTVWLLKAKAVTSM